MPAGLDAPWDRLFDIVWEPPCMILRKPARDAPLLVNGQLVRQDTFVLLHNVEIALGGTMEAHLERGSRIGTQGGGSTVGGAQPGAKALPERELGGP